MEDRSSGVRSWSLALGSASGIVLTVAAAGLGAAASRGASPMTVSFQALLIVAGLSGAWAMWRCDGVPALGTVVVVALAARVLLAGTAPLQSNDIYRYLWDGRVLLHGVDPYVVAPDSAQLHALRAGNWLYAHIDWRSVPTLYPPVDLALFALGAVLSHASVLPLKLVMLAGDLLTLGLIGTALRAAKMPLGRLALYAWNPLVIVEFALNGHEEGWAFAFLVATVIMLRAQRPFGAAFAIAGAALTKLYPLAFFAVFFARRSLVPAALAGATLIAVAYAPFVFWNRNTLGFLHAFAFQYHFNDSLHRAIGTTGGALAFVAVLIAAAIALRRGANAVVILIALELAYLLLSPNVYPWYVAVFAALLPLVPGAFSGRLRVLSIALIAWTALAPLAYLAPWVIPYESASDRAAHALEYAPLAFALLWYVMRDGRRVLTLLAGAVAVSGCAHAGAAQSSAMVARGATFYATKCAFCHTPTRTSFIGPDLTHIAGRRSATDLRHHIATSVPDGATFSAATVNALVAYLEARNERSGHR